jgi:hypothetical protein
MAATATAEKKTLKIEEKAAEPPPPTISRAPLSEDVPEEAPWEPEVQEAETTYEDIPAIAETRTEVSRVRADSISDIYEFTASMPVKNVPLTAEDLEHVEDGRLDAAYENKLLWSGDDLRPIPNASKLVESLGAVSRLSEAAAGGETANGSAGAAAARARINIPVFEEEEISDEVPVLPENPSEEELFAYAQKHPVIKKALRVFRGKIVEVKKL